MIFHIGHKLRTRRKGIVIEHIIFESRGCLRNVILVDLAKILHQKRLGIVCVQHKMLVPVIVIGIELLRNHLYLTLNVLDAWQYLSLIILA